MELILISGSKLKIILDADESKKYNVADIGGDVDVCDRGRLSGILEDVYRLSGFDTRCDNLSIEIFESRSGGCEIFITKEEKSKSYTSKEIKRLCRECLSDNVTLAYIFKTVNDLILVCKLLGSKNLPTKSRAFCIGNKNFYLILTFLGFFTSELYTSLEFISEFGERISTEGLEDYLGEHGREICDGEAIETLSSF